MELSDGQLLTVWLLHRNAQAFHAIVRRHAAMVFHTALRILKNRADAEDTTQECFKALVAIRETDQIRSLSAWLHGMATKLSLMHIRSNSRRVQRETRYAESLQGAGDPNGDRELFSLIDQAIESLDERYRIPIIAHFLLGESHADIAQQLKLARSTVTNHINQGVRQIESILKRKGALPGVVLASWMATRLAVAAPVAPSLLSKLGTLALAQGAGPARYATITKGLTSTAGKWVGAAVFAAASIALIGWLQDDAPASRVQPDPVYEAPEAQAAAQRDEVNSEVSRPPLNQVALLAHAGSEVATLRTLQFPDDSRLGSLSVLEREGIQSYRLGREAGMFSEYDRWVELAPARGEVVIPAGKPLKLTIYSGGLSCLQHLENFGPDDLHTISFQVDTAMTSGSKVTDERVLPHIQHLTGLKVLEMIGVETTGRGLQFIRGLRNLQRLEIGSESYFEDVGLTYLQNLAGLEVLNLFVPVSDEGLRYLSALPSLRELSLKCERIRGPGFTYVARIPSLEFLEIRGDNNTGGPSSSALKHLSGAHSLKALLLFWTTNITDAAIPNLAKIPNLEDLKFVKMGGVLKITDAGMPHLAEMTKLRRLDLGATMVTDDGLVHLRGLTRLDSLRLPLSSPIHATGHTITDTALREASQHKELRYLFAGSGEFTDEGLLHLANLEHLEKLVINSSGSAAAATDRGLSYISVLPRLRSLDIEWRGMTNVGLSYLAKMTTLEHLSFGSESAGVTVGGVNALNNLTNLKQLMPRSIARDEANLDLSALTELEVLFAVIKDPGLTRRQTAIRNDDLSWIGNLRNLTYLSVGNSPFLTDEGLAPVAELTNLERLFIGGERIGDGGLAHLQELNSLYQLGVSGNFTDRGLQQLDGLTNIRYLTIESKRGVSYLTRERFQRNLPNLYSLNVN